VHPATGQRVAPGDPAVDDHDGCAGPGGMPGEAQPGHDGQRGTGDQQRIGRLDGREGERDPFPRHILAEEHRIYTEAVRLILSGKFRIEGRRVIALGNPS